ncbi:MAG TPA: hypothetical protein ENN68_01395 [Methanomicrobia archaeon]|nr:hypothetical protein [Methanomicrobia archaeon]
MKKILVIALTAIVVATILSPGVIASEARGLAPNAGDGVPDGPGWSGDWVNDGNPGVTKGPAPNAGDGIPDGSGF